ncbi:hypothetical protein GGR50DRAFT_699089 [Xylaria sp. CBS 124048]|nr:hypothetical protein GGR50DRAFT_699089 [Xylaria sp. CBS 124048]
MPSQQKLSGCLSPAATFPCRNCMVHGDDKADLDFDIVNQGRYHMQTEIARQDIKNRARSHHQEEIMFRNLGLHNNEGLLRVLGTLFPALDMIRSRPVDAAHSEYQGMSRILHNLMFKDQISLLTPTAITEACSVYQSFPTPPKWGRLQSPKRHLDSWRMQELARGAVILPVLLRCWLQPHHIKDECRRLIPQIAGEYFENDDFVVPTDKFEAVDWIVSAVDFFSRSVRAIFGHTGASSPKEDVLKTIISGRRAIQFLCQINASACLQRRVTRTDDATSVGTEADDGASTVASSTRRKRSGPQDKARTFLNMKRLPNIHTGLHLMEVIREYGSCRLVWTLMGEDKHK